MSVGIDLYLFSCDRGGIPRAFVSRTRVGQRRNTIEFVCADAGNVRRRIRDREKRRMGVNRRDLNYSNTISLHICFSGEDPSRQDRLGKVVDWS